MMSVSAGAACPTLDGDGGDDDNSAGIVCWGGPEGDAGPVVAPSRTLAHGTLSHTTTTNNNNNTNNNTPSSTESYQNKRVRPALNLSGKAAINAGVWNDFLALKPDVRARIERQTSWRGPMVGVGLANAYSTLSSLIHVHQEGDRAVTISVQNLAAETCLGAAALLDDFVLFDFDPPTLAFEYEKRRQQQEQEQEQEQRGGGGGEGEEEDEAGGDGRG